MLTAGSATSGLGNAVAHAATVQVKDGDTLKSVAQEHNMTVKELAKTNNLSTNSQLKANQKLNVPDIPKVYVVKAGDTVSEIAEKYNLKTTDILTLNHLDWNSKIFVGQKIKLRDSKNDNKSVQNNTTATVNNDQSIQGNSVSAKAVNIALELTKENIPYVWGGASKSGMDCSGLVDYVYAQLGIQLPHYTGAIEKYVSYKPVSEAQPGDLLFWGAQGSSYHVAIYIGNGQFVAAPTFGQNVSVGSISSFTPSFAGTLNIK